MSKLLILLLISLSSPVLSKLMMLTNDEDYVNEYENNLTYEDFSDGYEDYNSEEESKSLWVLKIENELDSIKLRRGNLKEEVMFDEYMAPYMTRFHPKHNLNTTSKTTVTPVTMFTSDVNYLKSELMETINKFILSIREEPTIFLSNVDEYSTPSLTLYFKGIHTSMMVNSGEKIWQYVLSPKTVLPEWFYTEHKDLSHGKDGAYVEIPVQVKLDFYKSLLHLLKLFFSHPV